MQHRSLDKAQNGGLQPAEAHVQAVALHVRKRERHGLGVAERSETVQDGAAGIAESEQLGNFVVGFASSIVAGAPQQAVRVFLPRVALDDEHVAVAAANDQGQGRKFYVTPGATLFQHYGVDMPLDVIDAEERNPQGSGKALGVSDAHQERPYEPRAAGHADST